MNLCIHSRRYGASVCALLFGHTTHWWENGLQRNNKVTNCPCTRFMVVQKKKLRAPEKLVDVVHDKGRVHFKHRFPEPVHELELERAQLGRVCGRCTQHFVHGDGHVSLVCGKRALDVGARARLRML